MKMLTVIYLLSIVVDVYMSQYCPFIAMLMKQNDTLEIYLEAFSVRWIAAKK